MDFQINKRNVIILWSLFGLRLGSEPSMALGIGIYIPTIVLWMALLGSCRLLRVQS